MLKVKRGAKFQEVSGPDPTAAPREDFLFNHPKHGPEFALRRRPDGMVEITTCRGGVLAKELQGLWLNTQVAREAVRVYKGRVDKRFARGEKEM